MKSTSGNMEKTKNKSLSERDEEGKACVHVFDSDGAPCRKCGLTVAQIILKPESLGSATPVPMEQPSAETGLAPCPWCGDENLSEHHVGEIAHYVQCDNIHCAASGPVVKTLREALNAWNKRAPLGEAKVQGLEATLLAEKFHHTYERLANQFAYETRKETRQFDRESPNGRLMIAVCAEIIKSIPALGVPQIPVSTSQPQATEEKPKEPVDEGCQTWPMCDAAPTAPQEQPKVKCTHPSDHVCSICSPSGELRAAIERARQIGYLNPDDQADVDMVCNAASLRDRGE